MKFHLNEKIQYYHNFSGRWFCGVVRKYDYDDGHYWVVFEESIPQLGKAGWFSESALYKFRFWRWLKYVIGFGVALGILYMFVQVLASAIIEPGMLRMIEKRNLQELEQIQKNHLQQEMIKQKALKELK